VKNVTNRAANLAVMESMPLTPGSGKPNDLCFSGSSLVHPGGAKAKKGSLAEQAAECSVAHPPA
jgi:hypothetical protein